MLVAEPERGGSAISHLLNALFCRVWKPRAKLQLVKTSRSPPFSIKLTNGKGFCQEFCHRAERSANGQKVLPPALA